jgi:hypothetical protein
MDGFWASRELVQDLDKVPTATSVQCLVTALLTIEQLLFRHPTSNSLADGTDPWNQRFR